MQLVTVRRFDGRVFPMKLCSSAERKSTVTSRLFIDDVTGFSVRRNDADAYAYRAIYTGIAGLDLDHGL